MLLVVKCIFCYNCIVIVSTSTGQYRCFTHNIWKHPDTGEELYSEDKVIKALEKKFGNGLAYYDKDSFGPAGVRSSLQG